MAAVSLKKGKPFLKSNMFPLYILPWVSSKPQANLLLGSPQKLQAIKDKKLRTGWQSTFIVNISWYPVMTDKKKTKFHGKWKKISTYTLRLYYYKCCYKYCKWHPRAYRMLCHLNENTNKIVYFCLSTMPDFEDFFFFSAKSKRRLQVCWWVIICKYVASLLTEEDEAWQRVFIILGGISLFFIIAISNKLCLIVGVRRWLILKGKEPNSNSWKTQRETPFLESSWGASLQLVRWSCRTQYYCFHQALLFFSLSLSLCARGGQDSLFHTSCSAASEIPQRQMSLES